MRNNHRQSPFIAFFGTISLVLATAVSGATHPEEQAAIPLGLNTANPLLRSFDAKGMRLVRIYTGPDGKSHVREYSLAAKDLPWFQEPSGYLQYFIADAVSVDVFSAPANHRSVAHNPEKGHPEMVFVIAGSSVLELSGGDKVSMGPGTIMLLDDFDGPGHWGQVGADGYTAVHFVLNGLPAALR